MIASHRLKVVDGTGKARSRCCSQLSPNAEYRKRRRAQGLCGMGGCPVISGDRYFCNRHELHQCALQRFYYQRSRQRAALASRVVTAEELASGAAALGPLLAAMAGDRE